MASVSPGSAVLTGPAVDTDVSVPHACPAQGSTVLYVGDHRYPGLVAREYGCSSPTGGFLRPQ